MALLWLEVALDEEGKMTEVRVVAADSMGSIQSKLPAELLNKAGGGAGMRLQVHLRLMCFYSYSHLLGCYYFFLSGSAMT